MTAPAPRHPPDSPNSAPRVGTSGPDGSSDGGSAGAEDARTADTPARRDESPEPLHPVSRRVRLVVDVLDDPDELALAIEKLGAQPGWRVRRAEERDGLRALSRRVALVVDVWERGSRWTVAGAVREQAVALATNWAIAMWVREVKRIRPESAAGFTTVRVQRRAPRGAGPVAVWLWRQWAAFGGADVQHELRLPERPGESEQELKERVREEWSQLALGGREFDSERYELRLTVGPSRRRGEADGQRRVGELLRTVGPWTAIAAVMLVCGGVLASSDSPWRWLAALPPLLLFWPVGRWATDNQPRPRVFRAAVGALLVGSATVAGYVLVAASPYGPGQQLVAIGVVLLLGFTLIGCWHALHRSWLSRNLHWLLPAVLALLPFVLPWAGSFLHGAYLEDILGIPYESVHIAFYWKLFVALEPLLWSIGFTCFFIALWGWARYTNRNPGAMLSWLTPLLILVYVLTVLTTTLDEVSNAAARAAHAASEGRKPPSYYGIQGRLMCLRPLEKGKPVFVSPGPVPLGRPVLVFPVQGGELWVWDPDRARGQELRDHAVHLRAEDFALFPARGGGCPREG